MFCFLFDTKRSVEWELRHFEYIPSRVVYDSINSNQFNHDKFGKPIKSIKSEQFSGIDSIDSNATMKGINQLNQTTQTKIYIRFFAPPTWKSVHSSLVYLPTYLPTEETKILSFKIINCHAIQSFYVIRKDT